MAERQGKDSRRDIWAGMIRVKKGPAWGVRGPHRGLAQLGVLWEGKG